MENKTLCFDLEGPLSPQDNAFEVMQLIPNGERIFEVISRYDDLLALEAREGYEAGDTLSLILPFLIKHRISGNDIKAVSDKATLVEGSTKFFESLERENFSVYIISTSYEQHAHNVAQLLKVPTEHVFCTRLPLNRLLRTVSSEEVSLLSTAEKYISEILYDKELSTGKNDREIKKYLDEFYWEKLCSTSFEIVNQKIQVMGGRRKVRAIEKVARKHNIYLENMVFVGDSITDAQAIKVIEAAGGLAIVFNGNAFAIPYGTVGVASTNLLDLLPIMKAWRRGGRKEVKEVTKELVNKTDSKGFLRYSWLSGSSNAGIENVIKAHKKMRMFVRKQAGKLG